MVEILTPHPLPIRPSVRKLPNGHQGLCGDGGPGKTAFFKTMEEAAAWSITAKRALRAAPRRRRGNARDMLGVTYSNGKWYARSPAWWAPKILRVFTVNGYGFYRARSLARMVARNNWMKS